MANNIVSPRICLRTSGWTTYAINERLSVNSRNVTALLRLQSGMPYDQHSLPDDWMIRKRNARDILMDCFSGWLCIVSFAGVGKYRIIQPI
jgi:hypothetical protein